MSDFLSWSIVVALTAILYGAIQAIKAIFEVWRGRSTRWLRVFFIILEPPESEPLRNIFPYHSGLVLIENHGPVEEFISALHYSVAGSASVEAQCYRQMFGRAIDVMKEESKEQIRFDRAVKASDLHSKRKIRATLGIDPMTLDEWQDANDAMRREVDNAFQELEKERKETVFINYPINIPPNSTKRIDFEIPEKWESDLDSITCLTVQTSKEILHVNRGYAKPSSPCQQFKCRIRRHLLRASNKTIIGTESESR